MFDNDKYMTTGIQQNIPLELQLFMWNCINTLRNQSMQLDYLQVFELTKEKRDNIFFQKIIHKQENPHYEISYRLFPKEIVCKKIFVIDNNKYSTMLLSEEY